MMSWVAVLLLTAGRAHADNGMGGIVRGFAAAGFIAELGIPDMQLVFGADDHRFGLVGRVTDTDEERRYDVALDLQLPLTSDEY